MDWVDRGLCYTSIRAHPNLAFGCAKSHAVQAHQASKRAQDVKTGWNNWTCNIEQELDII